MNKKSIGVMLCLLAVAGVYWFVQAGNLEPPGPPAPTGRMTIFQADIPLTIDTSGSYLVKENLTGVAGQNGITIAAEDVTLDLDGFALIGVPGSGDGITTSDDRKNITVKNGTVANWAEDGIDLSQSTDVTVTDIRAFENGRIGIVTGGSSLISNCISSDNGIHGIRLDTPGSIVDGCVSVKNLAAGISTVQDSLVRNCLVRENDTGIIVGANSFVINNEAIGNGLLSGSGSGITAAGEFGEHCRIEANHAVGNWNYGIDAQDCFVFKNSAWGNGVGAGHNGNYRLAGVGAGPIEQPATATHPFANLDLTVP